MILFRRVRVGVKRITPREWALLTLETFGILAGILIAFQLNEWAAARKEARAQRALLERLFDEAEATVAQLRFERDAMSRMTSHEAEFTTALVRRGECPPAAAWSAVDTLAMYPAITAPSSVYQEMMGSGGLAMVDERVRRSVGDFYGSVAWAQSQNDYFRSVREPLYSNDDPRITIDYDRDAEEQQVTRFDREAFCADRSFRNAMAAATRDHQMTADVRKALTKKAIQMCAAIGQVLGQQCEPHSGGPLAGEDLAVAGGG